MRTLVDLINKIVIISWKEVNVYPFGLQEKANALYHESTYRQLSAEKQEEFEKLKQTEGEVRIVVNSITVSGLKPIRIGEVSTTYMLTGDEFFRINEAIQNLKDQVKEKKVLLADIYESVEY